MPEQFVLALRNGYYVKKCPWGSNRIIVTMILMAVTIIPASSKIIPNISWHSDSILQGTIVNKNAFFHYSPWFTCAYRGPYPWAWMRSASAPWRAGKTRPNQERDTRWNSVLKCYTAGKFLILIGAFLAYCHVLWDTINMRWRKGCVFMAYGILLKEAKDIPEDVIEQAVEFIRFMWVSLFASI